MLDMVQSTYDILDNLHLSVGALAVIGFALALTLLFSMRELAAWFFKVDGLKREMRELTASVQLLQLQIRKLQEATATERPSDVGQPLTAAKADRKSSQFPISH